MIYESCFGKKLIICSRNNPESDNKGQSTTPID